ncbi:DNA repair protein XRCC3-like isoform X2 [Lineus longissimus]|uniref:DNA repair protein XRCC3-like isoform X2 n=1 Tax=Lineus longissimus TaxID=88925 RepID=UPI002B4F4F47
MDALDVNPRILKALEKSIDLLNGDVPSLPKHSRLSMGCHVLDAFLHGGIPSRGITEIAGESGSGKTQICLQLCLTAQLPKTLGGLDGGAVYVCTEDVFPNKRLHQMMKIFTEKYKNHPDAKDLKPGDKIFIEHASEKDDLTCCINKRIPMLLTRGLVKLIVIDSMAALFRCDYSVREAVHRAKDLGSFGSRLRGFSDQHGVPVVCVNQVTDVVGTGDSRNRKSMPALGLTWSNQVTTRLLVSRTNQVVTLSQRNELGETVETFESTVRILEVGFAPHLPQSQCQYIVDEEGVKGLS